MGQRMPDEDIEYGNDCFLGWPPGLTPKFVYARFIEMVHCIQAPPFDHPIPPNDRTFKLQQITVMPCNWKINSGDWEVTFGIIGGPVRSTITLFNTADFSTYFYEQVVALQPEGVVFHNTIDICQPWYGARDGICVVTWSPQATKILSDLNITKSNELMMELRPLDNNLLVYKFCKVRESTNIAILFDPTV